MKIYTRTGDDGTTSLVGGRRVPKHDIRIEAYGTVDELISWLGLIRSHAELTDKKEIIIYIQGQLMASAAALAHDANNPKIRQILPSSEAVAIVEADIDKMEKILTPLDSFILPGGTTVSAHCHIARTVCRRAERAILRLNATEAVPSLVLTLVNRLSDWLFVLGRYASLNTGNQDVKWVV